MVSPSVQVCRRLSEEQRLAILHELDQPGSGSIKSIASRYKITPKAVRKLRANKDAVLARCAGKPAATIKYLDQDDEVKRFLVVEVKNSRGGTFGVAHGRPPSLMDAAELSVVAWGEVTSTTISNCFRKANLGVVYCKNSDASVSVVSGVASNDDTDIDAIMHTGEMVSLLLADLPTGA